MDSGVANQAALPESFYKEEELFTVKVSSKREARTKWKINEGVATASFNKWVSLNIKQKLLQKVDTKGFLSVFFKQELRVEMVELGLA